MRREKKRQKYEKLKNGKPILIRSTIRLDYRQRKELLKKSGLSLQKTIEMLVNEYLKG